MTAESWGRAFLFDDFIAISEAPLVRASHQHGALQLSISVDGSTHRVGEALDAAPRAAIVLVGANVPHAYDCCGGRQMLFWLPPEARLSRNLTHTYLGDAGIARLPTSLLRGIRVDELASPDVHPRIVRDVSEALLTRIGAASFRPPEALHPGVRKAIAHIQSLETKCIAADALAAHVGLSKGRLLHVFREHMGLPLRRYLQWLRCLDAMVLLDQGHNATAAATGAGFSDGAHLTRTMKRYLCIQPSNLGRRANYSVERIRSEIARKPISADPSTVVQASTTRRSQIPVEHRRSAIHSSFRREPSEENGSSLDGH